MTLHNALLTNEQELAAIRASIIYTLQLSDKSIRALAPERFLAALEQDGYTVASLAALDAAEAREAELVEAIKNFTITICGDDELPHEESDRTFHIMKALVGEKENGT